MSIYTDKGYKDRKDYLKSLAEEYDVPYPMVWMFATSLGENEDFDGLIATIEDYQNDMFDFD